VLLACRERQTVVQYQLVYQPIITLTHEHAPFVTIPDITTVELLKLEDQLFTQALLCPLFALFYLYFVDASAGIAVVLQPSNPPLLHPFLCSALLHCSGSSGSK
jgi:hypothetical protein